MAESFLLQCRENFYSGITPSNKNNYEKEGYKKIVLLSQFFFKNDKYEDFLGYFMEGQYLISLWAAHMLIEYGDLNKKLGVIAMNKIKTYIDNPLAPGVATEEQEWLTENTEKYKEYL